MKQQSAINEAAIGKRIRSIRNARRITLEDLAIHTGYTKGYLSKVEKSEKAPPVSTLGILARALGVSISNLLGEEDQATSICLVRKAERPKMMRTGTSAGYSYEAVAQNFKNKMMDPFILTLPVHAKKQIRYQHAGQEILFVLEGTMKFHHGTEVVIAEEGDCVYIDSGIPHFGESMGDKPVKCFTVIVSDDTK